MKIKTMRIRRWLAYLPGALGWLIAGCIAGTPPSIRLLPMDPAQRTIFESGVAAYDEGNYPQAIKIFQGLIASYPGSPVLMEAQWMLGRTYEDQGHWRWALAEYRSFLSNFPTSDHRMEAGLRIGLLSELLAREAQRKVYPSLRGIEVDMEKAADMETFLAWLQSYRDRGFNTLVVGDGGSFASIAHQQGFRVLARVPARQMDLFKPEGRTHLKRLLSERVASEVDGVLFDHLAASPTDEISQEALDGFQRDFSVEVRVENILRETSLYWRWLGWRSRETMKILKELMEPVRSARSDFYWGIVFPSEAVTAPHQALAQTGLDLLEAKQQGLDYFGIGAVEDQPSQTLLAKARDFIGDPARILVIVNLPDPEALRPQPLKPSDYGILYLNTRPSSSTVLTKNPR